VKRIGNAVVSVVGRDDSGPSTPPTPAEKAKNESKSSLTTAEDQPETPVVYSSPDEDDEAADEDEEEDGEEEEDNDDSDTTIEHQVNLRNKEIIKRNKKDSSEKERVSPCGVHKKSVFAVCN
jgi:hypothetical protein